MYKSDSPITGVSEFYKGAKDFGGTGCFNWTGNVVSAKKDLVLITTGGNTYSQTHEIRLDGSANKYICVGMTPTKAITGTSPTQYNGQYFSTDGVNFFKNVIAYLVNNTASYVYPITAIIPTKTNSSLEFINGQLNNASGNSIVIYNLTGQQLIKAIGKTINLSILNKGIYIAKDENGNTLKFIK